MHRHGMVWVSSVTSILLRRGCRWLEWAKAHGLCLDFNPTYFAHPKAADGFTLAHEASHSFLLSAEEKFYSLRNASLL